MYPQLAIVSGLLCLISSETTAPGIDRRFSDGVKSNGYRMIYGNEDISIINNVVDEMEKYNPLKENRRTMMETLHPLAPEDVKCMMSVDRYCSHSMLKTKEVLIQALKNDCEKCTNDEKDNAGLVAAAMMAYEPVAWKLFLTRAEQYPNPRDGGIPIPNSVTQYNRAGISSIIPRSYDLRLPPRPPSVAIMGKIPCIKHARGDLRLQSFKLRRINIKR